MNNILPSFISAAVTLLVCMINNRSQYIMAQKKHERTIELIDYRLTELSARVDKHNTLVERTYNLEKRMDIVSNSALRKGGATLFFEKIKSANRRIEVLEKAS